MACKIVETYIHMHKLLSRWLVFSTNIFQKKYMQVKMNHVSNANRETKLQQIFQTTKKKNKQLHSPSGTA